MERSLEEKLAAIKMVEDGQSARSVLDKLKVGHHLLYEWLDIYRNEGKKRYLWLATRMGMPTVKDAPGIEIVQTYNLKNQK